MKLIMESWRPFAEEAENEDQLFNEAVSLCLSYRDGNLIVESASDQRFLVELDRLYTLYEEKPGLSRRGFLKGLLAVGATAAIPSSIARRLPDNAPNPGAALLAYNDFDAIGTGIKEFLGADVNFPIKTGHAWCAIVTPISDTKGRVTCVNFGPPVCKNKQDKLATMYRKNLSKYKVPIMLPCTVRVKRASGTVSLENRMLTEKGAGETARKLNQVFRVGNVTWVATNGVNPEAALEKAGKNGRCKLYSVVPVGFDNVPLLGKLFKKFGINLELDLDNCASFAIDVVAAGKPGLKAIGSNSIQLLSSPNIMIQAARENFAPTFSGKT